MAVGSSGRRICLALLMATARLARGGTADAELALALGPGGGPAAVVAALGKGADPGNERGERAPLWSVLSGGKKELVELLVKAGADVRLVGPEGLTPLHRAAAAGASDPVEALLEAGAEPEAKDAAGRTPADLARQAGHKDLAARLDVAAGSAPAPAGAVKIAAGSDLAAAVRKAKDGATLLLAPGEYGAFDLAGKALTVQGADPEKTVLRGGTSQALVFVAQGARLRLVGVTLKGGGTTSIGLAVQKGTAEAAGCRFLDFASHGAYVQAGDLRVRACRFAGASRVAVISLEGSRARVESSRIEGAVSGVAAQDSGGLAVVGCRIEGATQGIQCVGSGEMVIRYNRIETGSRGEGAGLLAEVAGACLVAGNRIVGADQAVAIRGRTIAIRVVDNSMVDCAVGLILGTQGVEGGQGARVARNAVLGSSKAGLILRQAGVAHLDGNLVAAADGAGVVVEGGARAHLVRQALSGGKAALFLDGAEGTQVSLEGCFLDPPEASRKGNLELPGDELTVRIRLAAGLAGLGTSQGAALGALLQAVRARGAPAEVELEAAVARWVGSLAGILGLAARLGTVALSVIDGTGGAVPADFEVYAPGPAGGLGSLVQAPRVVRGGRSRALVAPGSYRVQLAGSDLPIHGALLGVEPGADRVGEAVIPEALGLRVRIPGGNGSTPATERTMVVLLKPAAGRSLALARRNDGDGLRPDVAAPRDEASEEDRRQALALAREWATRLRQPRSQPGSLPAEALRRKTFFREEATRAVRRILMLLGTAEDAKALLEPVSGETRFDRVERALAAGYIECRLGSLERGALMELARSPDRTVATVAAEALGCLGSSRGRELLVGRLGDPGVEPWAKAGAAAVLCKDPRPGVLAAMRAAAGADSAEVLGLPAPVVAYLLTWGGPRDWAGLTARAWSPWSVFQLAPMVRDPRPLYSLALDRRDEFALVAMDEALSLEPEATEAKWLRALHATIEEAAWLRTNPQDTATIRGIQARRALERHKLRVGFFRPSPVAAQRFHEATDEVPGRGWVPQIEYPGAAAPILDGFAQGTLEPGRSLQLDYLEPAVLERELGARGAIEAVPEMRLLLAAHRVGSRGNYYPYESLQDGTERRPFVLREDLDSAGSVSGIIELRPWLEEGRLRLRIALRTAFYLYSTNLITSTSPLEQWKIFPYLAGEGRALVKEVRLMRGERPLELRPGPGGTGDFAAVLPPEGLAGLWVEVELGFFQQRRVLRFDLFDSQAARRLRRLAARSEAWERRLQVDPADPVARLAAGRTLAARGLVEAARIHLLRAVGLDSVPGAASGVAANAAALLADCGRHEDAVGFLEDQVRRDPEDALGWRDLGDERYLLERYGPAAEAYGRARGLGGDPVAAVMEATCRLLAGDRIGARGALEALPPAVRARVAGLRYVCAAPDDPAAADAIRDDPTSPAPAQPAGDAVGVLVGRVGAREALGPAPTPALACRVQCYAGYRALFDKRPDLARSAFEAALETGQVDQAEYRMARFELSRPGPGGSP